MSEDYFEDHNDDIPQQMVDALEEDEEDDEEGDDDDSVAEIEDQLFREELEKESDLRRKYGQE